MLAELPYYSEEATEGSASVLPVLQPLGPEAPHAIPGLFGATYDGEFVDWQGGYHFRQVTLTEPYRVVDPTYLLEYMIDDPRFLGFGVEDQREFEYHHLYFPRSDYNGNKYGGSLANRLKRLKKIPEEYGKLWEMPYSQVLMRTELEELHHQDHEQNVPRPASEVAKAYKKESTIFDALGAAAVGLEKKNFRGYFVKTTAGRQEAAARLDFYEERFQGALRDLGGIVIIPEMITKSVLMRLAIKTGNLCLRQEAEDRVGDSLFLPMRVPSFESLRIMADDMLKAHVLGEKYPEHRKRISTRAPQPILNMKAA